MILLSAIPWVALIPALGLLLKFYLDNRKLRLAEKESAQRIHEAGIRLMLEAADKLGHAPQHAHDRTECIMLLAAWVRAQSGPEWNLVEKDTVAFLRRMGAGDLIADVLLMSDHEPKETPK